ncbi:hypothetical protein F511_38948 [Dorcoceras hygrometricum]|uniref:Uncharacterized protein n=1 Tax=Dorcoceras hygrometricum TaxID=472368 RepID=A0A2Z7D3U8_9LAMI|nr:hypothetical protein F511_38948 [Dorcoceras hygrometricum]
MLSDLHLFVLEELKDLSLEHDLHWEKTCCSRIFEGRTRNRGAVIARSNTNTKSSCWIRTMLRVDNAWVIEPCADFGKPIPRSVTSSIVIIPSRFSYVDTLPTVSEFFKIMTKRWADVCLEVDDFCASRRLLPVGSIFLQISSRLGLKDAGIDQLNFHFVQLGYLKFLQMGNTDPNKTKAGNKYEVKPQYEELSKQINMQHAINQCYECMRLSKEISQLGQYNNRQIISCRLYTTVYQPGNHRSVIIRARQPITARWETLVSGSHRSDDSVGLYGHDPPAGQSQRGTQSGYKIKSEIQAQDGTEDLTACEQIPPCFKIAKPKISSNKSEQGIKYLNRAQVYKKTMLNQQESLPKSWKRTAQPTARLSSFAFSSQLTTASKIGLKTKTFWQKQISAFDSTHKAKRHRFTKTDPSVRVQLQNDGVLIKSDLTTQTDLSALLAQSTKRRRMSKTDPSHQISHLATQTKRRRSETRSLLATKRPLTRCQRSR